MEISYTSLPKPRPELCCLFVYICVTLSLGGEQSSSKWYFGSQVPGEVKKLVKRTGHYRIKRFWESDLVYCYLELRCVVYQQFINFFCVCVFIMLIFDSKWAGSIQI